MQRIFASYVGVIRRAFSEKEKYILENSADSDQMFFRIWTLKESFVKALGIGISYPLKSAEFLINDDIIMSVGCDGYSFTQIIVNQKFVCSLCLKRQLKINFSECIQIKIFSLIKFKHDIFIDLLKGL